MNEFDSERFKAKEPEISGELQIVGTELKAPKETRERLAAMAKITGYSVNRCLIECIDGIYDIAIGKGLSHVPDNVTALRIKK